MTSKRFEETPKAIRVTLNGLLREFQRCSNLYLPIFHEMFIPTCDLEGHSVTDVCQSFRHANSDHFDDLWEVWEGPASTRFFGRYYGDGDGLFEFQQLADSTYLVMREIDPSLPDEGHFGWLDLLYEMAHGYPTPLLRCTFHCWNSGDDPDGIGTPEDGGAPFPLCPLHLALIHNLFTSSIAAIELILDDGGALLVGECTFGLRLSFTAHNGALETSDVESTVSEAATKSSGPVLEYRFDGVWHLRFDTGEYIEEATLPERKGIDIYKELLDRPDDHISSVKLLIMAGQIRGYVQSNDQGDDIFGALGLNEVKEDIEQLQRQIDDTADPERQAKLKDKQEELIRTKSSAVNRWGRPRTFDTPTETLTTRIHGQLIRSRLTISTRMPKFAEYLKRCVTEKENDFVYHPMRLK